MSLHDELTVEPGPPGVRLVLEDEVSGVPADASNLAVRALSLLADAVGVEPAVTVRLRKGIPVAGGMAGGSADAAAALVAGDALWNLATPAGRLHELAAMLGSDVPFALCGGDALGTGRGERLTKLSHPHRRYWVLAVAGEGLSTPAVYAETDRQRAQAHQPTKTEAHQPTKAEAHQPTQAARPAKANRPEAADPAPVINALADPDPTRLAGALRNDLQPAALALRPSLADVLVAGLDAGALAGIVSGSGPTCAFLAADPLHAGQVANRLLAAALPAVHTVKVAHGSVAGAHLEALAVVS